MACSLDSNVEACNGCENTLISFILLTEDDEKLNSFLYNHCVLPRSKKCVNCETYMTLTKQDRTFRCYKRIVKVDNQRKKVRRQCRKSVSQLKNTWFENHNISRKIICRLVAFWCLTRPPRFDFLKFELGLNYSTICYKIKHLREVCVVAVTLDSQVLGGPGKIVELDEGKIGKRKCKRGLLLRGNWVFSGVERDSKKSFLVPVANRGHASLLSVIKQYILPGTTVVSECWKIYNCLQFDSYLHLSHNQSYNFIDPVIDADPQQIDQLWQDVRGNVSRYGDRNCHFIGHLAEFIFKRKYPDLKTRLHHIFNIIGKVYNGEEPEEISVEVESGNESEDDNEYEDF